MTSFAGSIGIIGIALILSLSNGVNKYIDSVMRILRPVVIGLIAAAALLLITEESFGVGYRDWTAWLIFVAAFIATKWLKLSPILMILCAAIIGLIIY